MEKPRKEAHYKNKEEALVFVKSSPKASFFGPSLALLFLFDRRPSLFGAFYLKNF
jgi:hypothetical protein